MKNADINQLAADVKKLTTENRSTGPRSKQGKLRSSLNAVRHGLAGVHLLLPGEDAEEYTRRMDAIFVALAPKDEAQAQLVALVADDLHKLDRLARIEQGLTLGRIEELLGMTQAAEKAAVLAKALTMLGAALTAWQQPPIPAPRTPEFIRRAGALSHAVEYVSDVVPGFPTELIDSFRAISEDMMRTTPNTIPMGLCQDLYAAAGKVMGMLMAFGDREDQAQVDLRKAIATIALPDETELKKLARYRKMLEDGLQRRLAALEQVRKLTVGAKASERDGGRAREYRVKLRVVA